jgi:hypothetical protein
MNRKAFLSGIAAAIAAPFVGKSEPEPNELPKDRLVEVSDVEDFVRKEVARQMQTIKLGGHITVRGEDIFKAIKRH